jgi:hypothetical protein
VGADHGRRPADRRRAPALLSALVESRRGPQLARCRSSDQAARRRPLARGQLDVELVLQRLLETARELTGARYAALGVLDAERKELERF